MVAVVGDVGGWSVVCRGVGGFVGDGLVEVGEVVFVEVGEVGVVSGVCGGVGWCGAAGGDVVGHVDV